MLKNIVMPAAGQTTDAATVVSIKAAVGDKVKRGDVLLDVETDKATLPIESVASGYVCRIFVEEYEKIDAGTLLMAIGSREDLESGAADAAPAASAPAEKEAEEDDFAPVDRPAPAAVPVSSVPAPAAAAAKAERTVLAMPNAKRAAEELGVKLEEVTASNGSFLTRADVEKHASAKAEEKVVPTSVMRDALAGKLRKTSVPVQTVTREVRAGTALGICAKVGERNGVGVTPGDLMMLALSRLCDRFPLLTAQYRGGKLVPTDGCSFALAYTGLNGTVSALVTGIEKMGLSALASANRKNAGALETGDLSCAGSGSLTVYDLSASGADSFIPTVSTPELAAFGIGRIRRAPVVREDGTTEVAEVFTVSLSYDAGFIDPPVAAELISQLAGLIEEPGLML